MINRRKITVLMQIISTFLFALPLLAVVQILTESQKLATLISLLLLILGALLGKVAVLWREDRR